MSDSDYTQYLKNIQAAATHQQAMEEKKRRDEADQAENAAALKAKERADEKRLWEKRRAAAEAERLAQEAVHAAQSQSTQAAKAQRNAELAKAKREAEKIAAAEEAARLAEAKLRSEEEHLKTTAQAAVETERLRKQEEDLAALRAQERSEEERLLRLRKEAAAAERYAQEAALQKAEQKRLEAERIQRESEAEEERMLRLRKEAATAERYAQEAALQKTQVQERLEAERVQRESEDEERRKKTEWVDSNHRDAFETQEEYASRLSALGHVEVGRFTFSPKQYDIASGQFRLPDDIQWQPIVPEHCRPAKGLLLKADRDLAKLAHNGGNSLPLLGSLAASGDTFVIAEFALILAGHTHTLLDAAQEEQQALFRELLQSMVEINPGKVSPKKGGKLHVENGFSICKYPVTQQLYLAVTGTNPSHFKSDENSPVETVSWLDAIDFCTRLNDLCAVDGMEWCLPEAQEWEYACRAGSTGDFGLLANGREGNFNEMAWFCNNSGKQTHPVGTKVANAWGLHDMHGNVLEWTATTAQNSMCAIALDSAFHSAERSNYNVGTDSRRNDVGFRLALRVKIAESTARTKAALDKKQEQEASKQNAESEQLEAEERRKQTEWVNKSHRDAFETPAEYVARLAAFGHVEVGRFTFSQKQYDIVTGIFRLPDDIQWQPIVPEHCRPVKGLLLKADRDLAKIAHNSGNSLPLLGHLIASGDTFVITEFALILAGRTHKLLDVAREEEQARLDEEQARQKKEQALFRQLLDSMVEITPKKVKHRDGFELRAFSICKYTVTQRLYLAVMGKNPSHFTSDENNPVETVSIDDAFAFCSRLNSVCPVDGMNWCLPDMDEWVYACSAGSKGDFGLLALRRVLGVLVNGPQGKVDEVAWYRQNSGNQTHPVGSKIANAFGLYDMHGNVWEWTATKVRHEGYGYYSCGGSYTSSDKGCAGYSHIPEDYGSKHSELGFRLALKPKS